MTLYDYAKTDEDGLVIALVNSAHVPNIEYQAHVVPAPAGDPPPGQVWQWSADYGWRLRNDPRGTTYVHPETGERVTISRVLQEPPAGYVRDSDLPIANDSPVLKANL